MRSHTATIVDQFTRQADAFANAPAIRDQQALDLLVSSCDAGAEDESLDVACGPGLVACAFGRRVRAATGIDLTPAMIRRAQTLAASMGLANVWFRIGEVSALPFAAGSFSIVTSRYAFHHFPEPARALKEMLRVGRPGARIAVMDMVASDDPARAARFNRMETLRDPSHVAALTLPALRQLFLDAGLPEPSIAHHQMQVELGAVMSASFPDPGDALRVRDMIVASIADDAMGVRTRVEGDKTLFSYPITLLVSAIPR